MSTHHGMGRSLLIFVRALLLICLCGCTAQRPDAPRELSRGLQGVDYHPRQPESWTMSNGLTVMFLPDEELPMVKGALFIRGGSFWESSIKPGAVQVMGDQMRQGGAGALGAHGLDRELERLAASVSSSFGTEFGKVGFSCLSSDLDAVFGIFADVVLRPRFEQDRIDLWKGQALEAIRRRTDDPSTIGNLSFTQLIYGETVYGRVTTDRDVRAIERADLLHAHAEFLVPQRSILALTGNVTRQTAASLAEKYFADWKSRGGNLPPIPAITGEPKPGIYFLTYPFAQSTILAGQLGPKRLSPDYPEIEVFNELFGSAGFSARLTKRVRTELGLAYGVYGGIMPGAERGLALIQLQTKAPSTGDALIESLRILEGLKQSPVTGDEIAEAHRSISNSFVFKFDSSEELVQRAALLKMLDYPLDYDATYVDKINGADVTQVQSVAQRRWDPSKFVVVVVGNETAYTALESALKTQPTAFSTLPLRRVRFDQKLHVD